MKPADYVNGKPGAHVESLFNRHGTPGDYTARIFRPPMDYYCPHVTVDGIKHNVVGPADDGGKGYMGFYTRKEAIASAQRFIDKCKEIVEGVT